MNISIKKICSIGAGYVGGPTMTMMASKCPDLIFNYGDIEIKITGLRPGEKLFEELLIDAEAEKKDHPLIFRAKESFIIIDEIIPKLEILRKNIDDRNKHQVLSLLNKLVKEWENKNKLNP